jgi:hypothetical protein
MEQVVNNMRASNTVVEKVKDAVVTIDGRQGTQNPGPLALTIVGDRWVGVLQPGV